MKVYKQIIRFEARTGNGGGNPDDINMEADHSLDRDELALLLVQAHEAGKDIGKLSARVVDKWYSSGLFKLFDDRFHRDPTVNLEYIIHSNAPLSEAEDGDESDDNNTDSDNRDIDSDSGIKSSQPWGAETADVHALITWPPTPEQSLAPAKVVPSVDSTHVTAASLAMNMRASVPEPCHRRKASPDEKVLDGLDAAERDLVRSRQDEIELRKAILEEEKHKNSMAEAAQEFEHQERRLDRNEWRLEREARMETEQRRFSREDEQWGVKKRNAAQREKLNFACSLLSNPGADSQAIELARNFTAKVFDFN